MTRKEQICDVAMEQFTYVKDENLKSALQFAFIDGVEWADKHPFVAWHNVSEEPSEENVYIIAIDENGIPDTFKVQEGRKYYFHSWFIDWKELVDKLNYKTWVYCNDLLQKTVKK